MNAEDIFRCSIGCETMLMIKARIRLIFSRNTQNKVFEFASEGDVNKKKSLIQYTHTNYTDVGAVKYIVIQSLSTCMGMYSSIYIRLMQTIIQLHAWAGPHVSKPTLYLIYIDYVHATETINTFINLKPK